MHRHQLTSVPHVSADLGHTRPGEMVAHTFHPYYLKKSSFGDDFLWGAATASFQIEGAHNIDGKGESVWDRFSHTRGKIKTKENADVACDFFNLYASDLEILKSLNMNVFRFSTSWTRLLPNGIGNVNPQGIDFYHRVIDKCLELNIEPWLTLYHWDLPQKLEDKGGWTNRDVIDWFSEYVHLVTKTYGDKVKNWMVLNEPTAFSTLGYFLGIHAPGRRGSRNFVPTVHHIAMCQAEGGRIVRANVPDAHIGTTFSGSLVQPYRINSRDQIAAERWDAVLNRMFIEPSLGMGYPTQSLPILNKMEKYIKSNDMETLAFDFDFIGLQNYTREVVKYNPFVPYLKGYGVKPINRGIQEITEMGWEIYPQGLYEIVKQFANYKGVKKIYITENGCAFQDSVVNNHVHDTARIRYFQRHLEELLKAKHEGVNLGGYLCWSLMDNFEWREGFKPRFGLVHVDFKTQKRTIKDSGLWFREFLK